MSIRWTILAGDEIAAEALADAAREALENGMRGGVALVVADAKRSVARGPKTGRIYTRGNISHQASAPGEPPATDTGVLLNSIAGDVEVTNGVVQGLVRASAKYALYLEFGTRKMAARPFLLPAVERNRSAILQILVTAVRSGVASVGRYRTK